MDAYSNGLQIISNNVANLDTLGYKAETVGFQDLYNSGNRKGLSYLGSNTGGAGVGVRIAPSQTDFSQGTLQQTGNALDLAIQGSGFLALRSNGQTYYTRTGSFAVGPGGDIVLQGSPAGTSYSLLVLNASNQAAPVDIHSNETSAPKATTSVTFGSNLSSTSTTASVSNITVFDAQGGSHTWKLTATASTPSGAPAGSTSWTMAVTDETGASIGSGTISFNSGQIDTSTSTITVTTTPPGGASALTVALDFSKVTSFDTGATSTLQSTNVDGNGAGTLSSVTVDSKGSLVLNYSNNTTKSLGQIAIADFQNPQLLSKMGGGIYASESGASPELAATGSANVGSVVSDQVEASNVNLTKEFGDLILIQRGFQASSQVVSVSNDMIQQLFGIRGQGA